MKLRFSKNKGFTLVELIVVIVILAILIGVSIGGLYSWVGESRKSVAKHNAEVIEKTLSSMRVTELFDELFYDYDYFYAYGLITDDMKKVVFDPEYNNYKIYTGEKYISSIDGKEYDEYKTSFIFSNSQYLIHNNVEYDKPSWSSLCLIFNECFNGFPDICSTSSGIGYYIEVYFNKMDGNDIFDVRCTPVRNVNMKVTINNGVSNILDNSKKEYYKRLSDNYWFTSRIPVKDSYKLI